MSRVRESQHNHPSPGRCVLAAAAVLAALGLAALAGCSSADGDLQKFIVQTEREPGGRVEPLPEIAPYQTFVYADQGMRSPFVPSQPAGGSGVRPDKQRHREFLEQFSLDTLRMVGTLKLGGETYGLIETHDGLVSRVLPGNYIGQNDGKIISITPSKILIRQIVPDGTGGYIEQPAALALSD
ncbi:MAG: pilus assembly protein PilP [Steroidobacteraceae bacterium]